MPPNETLISDRPVRFLAIDSFGTQAQPYFLTYLADMGATLRSCLPRSGTFPTHRPFYWVPPNFGGPKMGKQRSAESAQKRKGIVKDSDREGSRDKVPEDGSFRRAFESARTLAQKALERMRSKAVHPPEKK